MTEFESYFPPNLLLQILLKLAVKSLIRFAVVSKSWNSLITSPAFISEHLNLSSKTHASTLLLRRYDVTHFKHGFALFQDCKDRPFCLNFLSRLNFSLPNQLRPFRVVGSCNGIICLCYNINGEFPSIALWNPSIQKFITLPSPSISPQFGDTFVLGFGANNDDYKLVRFVYHEGDNIFHRYAIPPEVEIYSLSTGIWRRVVGVEIKHCIAEHLWLQAFVNGTVHWIADDDGRENGGVRRSVMSFSIADEVFGEITLPGALAYKFATELLIMVVEECLAVVKYEREIDGDSCEVWVMKHYGVLESWTRLHCINLVADMKRVVGFRKNGEVLFSTSSYELISYDPSTGHNKNLGIRGTPHVFYVQDYMESLVLLQEKQCCYG